MKKVVYSLGIVLILLTAIVLIARVTPSDVHVERTLNAPLEKVWQVWTDPEMMKSWWSPEHFTAPIIKSDFREGGNFLFAMKSPGGEVSWNTGTYKQIVQNEKIVMSMSFSDETGRVTPGSEVKVPGKWPDEILVTIKFKSVEGKTVVTVDEVGIPLIMKLFAAMGWEQQFNKFEKLL